MEKTIVTTVRLPERIIKIIDERAMEENLDRTTILRELLEESIRNWKIDRAANLYKEGKISLGKAAKMSELSVGEMMDVLIKKGVKSDLTVEEYKESLFTAFKIFGLKK